MKLVNKTIDIPLHTQLYNIIKEMIESKELKSGTYLMPERELCKVQSISRMTVNKAITNLVNEGFLDRIQGKGTFVAYKKQKNKHKFQSLKGFTEVMNDKGLKVRNKILSFELDIQDEDIREKLMINNNSEKIFKIERLRIIEEEPFAVETVYIPQRMCTDLDEELVEKNSLYKLFKEKYNHKIKQAIQTIEPIMLSEKNACSLEREVNSLALKFDRVVYTESDEVVEYTISIFTSDNYQYEIVLTNEGGKL